MPDARKPRLIPLPGGSANAPSGAIQFEDDWPGLFIRGDHAIALAIFIRDLELRLADTTDVRMAQALARLSALATMIEKDVRIAARD